MTICTQDRRCILSDICVGRGLGPAEVRLTPCGEIAEKQLIDLERRYPAVHIDKYVIMPDHVHAIVRLDEQAAGASPRPTLVDVICAYKSLTSRLCRKLIPAPKIFQTSFHDHVIRNETDYREVWAYIDGNPAAWQADKTQDAQ